MTSFAVFLVCLLDVICYRFAKYFSFVCGTLYDVVLQSVSRLSARRLVCWTAYDVVLQSISRLSLGRHMTSFPKCFSFVCGPSYDVASRLWDDI